MSKESSSTAAKRPKRLERSRISTGAICQPSDPAATMVRAAFMVVLLRTVALA
jgi:hypothetical protein